MELKEGQRVNGLGQIVELDESTGRWEPVVSEAVEAVESLESLEAVEAVEAAPVVEEKPKRTYTKKVVDESA